ncbi:zinc finger protein 644a isoform X2 [Salminus brasiliensis]|uniref:zinc finger protein 644a isoform X2 n=1 Tax=Salminus brasiliensis TaxID=930266 RepID=UPI003B82DB62
MSALEENTSREGHDGSISELSENLLSTQTFSLAGNVLEPSMQCPRENMTPNGDQADLLTHVRFIESICADGPAKAAYVNGSASPNISDEILLDISKNVPGFLPKSLHAQNPTVATSVQFEECDPLRKDGEMTIRQMLTAEDVENRGIWGFDEESPENSLDCYDDSNDLSWNPHKEFMKFLLEDHDRSEAEEKVPTIQPAVSHRRRKRKMDMVVMVDPSEEPYPELNSDSKNELLGEGSQTDNGDPQWKRPRSHSPVSKNAQYANGTAVALKHLFPKPAKNRKSGKLGFVPESQLEDDPLFYPSNSKLKAKSQNSQRPGKNHSYAPDPKPFICKECGSSFFDHNSLLRHITVHKKKSQKVKETVGLKDEGKDASLQCPQCTFGTNCPNTFVQHAKTHEKDKRYYRCQKCHFVAMNESELKGHMLSKHRVTEAQYLVMEKQEGFPEQKTGAADSNAAASFTCKLCSFKTRNKNIMRNHFEIFHRQVFDKDLVEDIHFTCSLEKKPKAVQPSSLCKLPSVGSQSPERETRRLQSEDSRKKQSPKSLEEPSLAKTDKAKRKANKKMAKNGSRLHKSMNTLITRKRRGQPRTSETDTNKKTDRKSITAKSPESGKCCSDDSLESEKEVLKSPSRLKGDLFALKERSSSGTLKSSGSGGTCQQGVSNNGEGSQEEKPGGKYKHFSLAKPSLKKSPSKRKMSTPFHNIQGQDILIDFPKCRQKLKKKSGAENRKVVNNEDNAVVYDSSFHHPEKCDVKDGLYINSQFLRKRSSPAKGSPRASSGHSEQDLDAPQSPQILIKEECMEAVLCEEAMENETSIEFDSDLKTCPYCPAEFESGISLSNHIRGHLHRVGLSCSDHHEASVAQTASPKKVPQVRRRMAGVPRVKTEDDHPETEETSEEQSELTCPMCREWFVSRIGLSNHVRGHLKRLGKTSSAAFRSPISALKEMMRDKKQFNMKLQALEKKCRASNKLYPFRINNGLVYSTAKVQRFGPSGKQHGQISSPSGEEKKRTEIKDVMKGSPSSDLIGILKKRRAHEEAKVKSSLQTARKALLISPVKERGPALQHCKALPNSVSAYDCKQRKQRSRKKTYPLLHTPEEIYRLTCRFCDLVFQGPLSVQEDWVKHLQRHIMNTAVPRTGAGMVEVTCFPKEPSSDTEAQAKPSS